MNKKKYKWGSRLKRYFVNGGNFKFEQADMPNKIEGVGTGKYTTVNYNRPRADYAGAVTQAANVISPVVAAASQQEGGFQNVGGMAASGAVSGAATGLNIGKVAGPWGAAIGAIGGAIGGGIYNAVTAGKRNEQVRNQLQAEAERERERKENIAKTVLNTYPTSGVKGAEFYQKMGGKMKYGTKEMAYRCGGKMKRFGAGGRMYQEGGMLDQPVVEGDNGGMIVPTSSNTATAVGAKHEQGGIDIGPNEIEGGEVLQQDTDGVNVFSDTLETRPGVTFAEEAERLSQMKGKYEEKINSPSMFARGTGNRQVQKLDTKLRQLFNQQEMMKQQQGIPDEGNKAQYGKKMFATPLQQTLPYASNIANALLTMKTPQIPDPVYDEVAPMKTTYNIRPQIVEGRRQLSNLQANLAANTADSNRVRNQMIGATLGNIGNMNQLYGQKENVETQLTNQARLNAQQVAASNVAKENQFQMNKMHRLDDIHQRISANVADASKKAQMQVREQNMFERDLMELELLKQKYRETGVWDRNIEGIFQQFLGSGDKKAALAAAKKLGPGAVKVIESIIKTPAVKKAKKKSKQYDDLEFLDFLDTETDTGQFIDYLPDLGGTVGR